MSCPRANSALWARVHADGGAVSGDLPRDHLPTNSPALAAPSALACLYTRTVKCPVDEGPTLTRWRLHQRTLTNAAGQSETIAARRQRRPSYWSGGCFCSGRLPWRLRRVCQAISSTYFRPKSDRHYRQWHTPQRSRAATNARPGRSAGPGGQRGRLVPAPDPSVPHSRPPNEQ